MKILILNGPNLNMIGKRDDRFYGVEDFEKILEQLRSQYADMEIGYYQSNTEGDIITQIQNAEEDGYHGIIINAGAYSHYSIAIYDALMIPNIAKVEVHFSNIYAREHFRHKSVISPACDGIIAGFGKQSYQLAVEWFKNNQRKRVGFN